MLKYLPILKRPGLVPSRWHDGEKTEDGTKILPWEEHAPEVSELLSDLYKRGFIEKFDWLSWQKTASHFLEDPQRLQGADLDTLRKLLTTHVRADRFCEGHFTAMIVRGHIVAILERLAELRQAMS